MTANEVITYFRKTYPGENIVALPQDNPTEIICEIDPTIDHPEINIAVAAITESAPHYHNQATESYKVLQGTLELYVDGSRTSLNKGDSYTVRPKQVHFAKGDFTMVEVTSKPGWTPEDHILVKP